MTDEQITTVNKTERFLLEWLGREDFSQLGECAGETFDGLYGRGLVQLHPIPEGRGALYRAVSLTDKGRAMLTALTQEKGR